tara:strand:- start:229 stop:651 length:423 start_codon:yes stop_codon:yes gene_type:complete
MAYVQKNNPIPKTGCGRRRVSAMKMQGKDMSLSPKEQAAKAQGREVGEMNKSSRFHPDNVGRGPKTAVKMKSPVKALDRSKARRNDPDDGVVSASEASGGMFMKSPMKGKLKPCQKAAAKKKFDVYPSAYANMWASNHKC